MFGFGQGIEQTIGKRITAVLVLERKAQPASQLFLFFDDGTYYELFDSMGRIVGISTLREGTIDDIIPAEKEASVLLRLPAARSEESGGEGGIRTPARGLPPRTV